VGGSDLIKRHLEQARLRVGIEPRRSKQAVIAQAHVLQSLGWERPENKTQRPIKWEISLCALDHRAIDHQPRVAGGARKAADFNLPLLPDDVAIAWQRAVL